MATGVERLVADPARADAGRVGGGTCRPRNGPAANAAREQAGGIVGYATDRPVRMAAFALAGRLYVAELAAGLTPRLVETRRRRDRPAARPARAAGRLRRRRRALRARPRPPGSPPRWPSRTGRASATAWPTSSRPRRWAGCAATGGPRTGTRCWSPGWTRPRCRRWHIADPEHPERPPPSSPTRPPAPPTPASRCTSSVWTGAGPRSAGTTAHDEYLVTAIWDVHELLIVVQPRDQRALRVLRVDPRTGATTLRHEQHDPAWVDIVPGVPVHTAGGALVTTADVDGARRLVVDGAPGDPAGAAGPRRARRGRRHRAVQREHRPALGGAVLLARRRAASG